MMEQMVQAGQGASVAKQLSFFGLLDEAWQIFKKNWSNIYMLGSIVVGVQIVLSLVGSSFFGTELEPMPLSGAVYTLISLPVQIVLSIGLIHVQLKLSRGETVEIPDLLAKKDRVLTYIAVSLLSAVMTAFGFVLLIIPGFYLALKYAFVTVLAIDKKMGAFQLLDLAGKLTQGKKLQLIGFGIGFFLFNVAGLLALGVGLLITMPVTGLAQMLLYTKLLENVEGNTSVAPTQSLPESSI